MTTEQPVLYGTRETFDGRTVRIYTDGTLTDRIGYAVLGGRVPPTFLHVFVAEIGLLNWDELRAAVVALKRAARSKHATDVTVREAVRSV